jgi:N-acylglucosamine-6-phosphate 2-epimerase
LPIIGIIKKQYLDSEIYITPTMTEVLALLDSPTDIIAMDATKRKHPNNASLSEMVAAVKKAGRLAMADISTYEEGIAAKEIGFDLVSTTLSGYTSYTESTNLPDFSLMKTLSDELGIPVIAEGNVKTPEQLVKALQCGVHFVIVGGAITRPQLITRDFVDAITVK